MPGLNNKPQRRQLFFSSYDLLYTLNLSLSAMLFVVNTGYPKFVDSTLLNWKLAINSLLKIHPHSNVGGAFAFMSSALLLAIFAAELMALAFGRALFDQLLDWSAGALGMLVAPSVWFGIVLVSGSSWPLWIPLEIICALIWAIVSQMTKPPSWCMPTVLIFHFGIWSWVFVRGFHLYAALLFPLIGGVLYLTWARNLMIENKPGAISPIAAH